MQYLIIEANIITIMEMKRISKVMIDIHSHIIPGIDDGAQNIDVTLSMLKNAEEDGTKKIIATPHYCMGYGEATIEEVKVLVKDLNDKVKEENIDIEIYSGQEVYFSENIINDYKRGIIGTLNDSRYMLIEFPMYKFNSNIFDVIYELQIMGIIPIIAHPERYSYIIDDPSSVNKFIDEGYLFQVNAGSIEGKFGKRVKRTAELLITNKIYSFIGSDAHNEKNRPTGLKEALKLTNKLYEKSEELLIKNSIKILNNEDVIFLGNKINKKKSIFTLFNRN
jgi:protein-tyrosine phosphatase